MDDKESNQKTSFFSWFLYFAMKGQEGDPGKEEIPGRKV
jgi:hypothetical protein